MIVYVATYPRSGSGVLRRAIYLNFGHLTADGYGPASGVLAFCEPLPAPQPVNGFDPDLRWADWIYTYTGPDGVRRRMIAPPALKKLVPEVRQELAAEPAPFFVKTHEPPYTRWYPGECVIQMTRHPAAAIASHYELEKAIAKDAPRGLAALTRGEGTGGDWSDYHRAWRAIPAPRLDLRYEAAFRDQAQCIRQIGDFLGFEPRPVVVETLAQAHARNPLRNPGRGLDGWREILSDEDYEAIRRRHGALAAELGYDLGAGGSGAGATRLQAG